MSVSRRRQLSKACPHELYSWKEVGLFERLICRLKGHKWEYCDVHQVAECQRCLFKIDLSEDYNSL